MKKLYCLSERAINVLKLRGLKWQIMLLLDINDPRTVDRHLKNNYPNGPLMNYHIKELIKEYAPYLAERDIYRKLTPDEIDILDKKKRISSEKYAKYYKSKKNEGKDIDNR